jgi:hypothetical protein
MQVDDGVGSTVPTSSYCSVLGTSTALLINEHEARPIDGTGHAVEFLNMGIGRS